jgi:hypothetical protein
MIPNHSVLLVAFFSCDWILLTFLISWLPAEWQTKTFARSTQLMRAPRTTRRACLCRSSGCGAW